MMFTDQGIALKFPKGVGSAFYGHNTWDLDGDFDADDLDCLAAIGAVIGIGFFIKNLLNQILSA